jgi:hypothetical protein
MAMKPVPTPKSRPKDEPKPPVVGIMPIMPKSNLVDANRMALAEKKAAMKANKKVDNRFAFKDIEKKAAKNAMDVANKNKYSFSGIEKKAARRAMGK